MASVFLYEPDGAMRDLLALQLDHLGHRVVEDGGDYAVAVVEPVSPEGLRIAHELRARAPAIPLVFVSVLPPSPETSALGAAMHLVKPVLLRDLRTALARCVTGPS
jgi:CheY-like chemotaxis protein